MKKSIAEWLVMQGYPYVIRIIPDDSFIGSYIAQGKRPNGNSWIRWKTIKSEVNKKYLEYFENMLKQEFVSVKRINQ